MCLTGGKGGGEGEGRVRWGHVIVVVRDTCHAGFSITCSAGRV